MAAIGFALASLAFAAALEITYKRYSALERSRGMFVAGIGVVWGSLQLVLWLQQAQPMSWDGTGFGFALAAGIAVAASNLLLIESLTHMDVSLGSTVYRLNTVAVLLLSFLFLAESVGTVKLLAVGFGVTAALLMYHGDHLELDLALVRKFFWLAVLASILRACFGVISKAALVQGVSQASILLTSAACWVVGGLAYAHFREHRVRITRDKLKYALLAGVLVFAVVNTLIWGLERGDASTVIPIANLSFVVVLVLSVLWRMERFTLRKALAVGLAAACVTLMSLAAPT
jgi:drug/metabolite transporter (DMT)-like permease